MPSPLQQIERNNYAVSSAKLQDFLDIVVEVAHTSKLDPKLVIEAARVLEMQRANDLYVANGEALDLQVSSLSELLQGLTDAVAKRTR